jgi:hypothetical protein
LAVEQHGVVAHHQLLALGVGVGAIKYWLQVGRLHQLYRGVYAVGHPRIDLHGRWHAAVLACGANAVLSHRDAAHLWGLRPSARRAIDVTAPGRSRHNRDRISIHRPRSLHRDDVTAHQRIPVTTVPRTLLDLAEVLQPRQLRRAYEESQRLELFDRTAIESVLARSPGRRGIKPLTALLDERGDAPHTKRELEALFYDMCREYGIPLPQVNVALLGYEVDAFWPTERVVVELDSWEFHKTPARHERDRVKQIELQLAGYEVVRVTWKMLQDPARLSAQLLTLLARAGARAT